MFGELPGDIQRRAKEAYRRFEQNPFHSGLNFKRVHSGLPIYAVRITRDYRAVGIQKDSVMVWFWIGSHSDYDKLLKQLSK